MPKRKIKWNDGDVFAIPLEDGSFSLGQILDLMTVNIVRIALYDEKIIDIQNLNLELYCKMENLISLVTSTREQLDYNIWKIIGNKEQVVPVKMFPYEDKRDNGWIGATTFDAAIIEDFVNSFYGFLPWDDWYDPNFLDEILVDINKKPLKLIYIKK
ncbi:MAG: hypothetical protein IPM69_05335 [Ignavibacteria bacterium]|nr:hypothetical protein [Ignavibacteria bacterium]